jgi:hypothetical protein
VVALTTNHQLPYPSGPDRPCDGWATWEALARRLDDKMVDLDAVLDRTARTRPMAKVSTRTPQQMVPGTGLTDYVVFDTVEVDTDGWVDLASNPRFITPKRTGLYHVVAWANYDNIDAASVGQVLLAYGAFGGFERAISQYEFAWNLYDTGAHIETDFWAASATSALGIQVNSAGLIGDDPRVTYAEMTMYWIGDRN